MRIPFLVMLLLAIVGSVSAQETELERLKTEARAAPRDADAQAKLGRAMLAAGRYAAAAKQLGVAAGLKRHSPEAEYEVIEAKFASGDHKASRGACRTMSKKHPGHPLTDVCMARAFLVWRRASLAFEYLDKALERDPGNVEALLALGDAQRISGQFEKSEQAYQDALKHAPDDARIYLGLGRLYVLYQKPDQAEKALRTALEKNSGSPDIQLQLARLVQGEERLKLLQKAAAGRPGWDDAEILLAEALLLSGKAEEAEKYAAAVVKRAGARADAWSVAGRARLALKNIQGAEEALGRALKLVPNDYEASLALAGLLGETNRPDDALEQYRAAADLDPRETRSLLEAARLCIGLGRKSVAAGYLERALARNGDNGKALALMGDVMVSRGDKAGAIEYYQRALKAKGAIDRDRVKQALKDLR